MEREQFKVLVKAMKAVYAQPTFIPDQDAFNVWFALLGDLPYKQAELAVQKHMATEKFPPTIADIREKAEQITSVKETEMSELEAWAIVRKAIGRSNYYAEEEFEKLPEACKMAVGNPSNLREWAMMDSDQVGTVEQRRTMMLEHKIRPTKKPDWDNIGKIVCDSLNNIAYHDDNQVVDAQVRKFFSENPRVEVTIRKVEG